MFTHQDVHQQFHGNNNSSVIYVLGVWGVGVCGGGGGSGEGRSKVTSSLYVFLAYSTRELFIFSC